jgi:uncharacterized protein
MESLNKSFIEINISNQSEGEHTYKITCNAKDLSLENFSEKIELDVSVKRVSNQFFVSCKVKGNRLNECDRCLIEFTNLVEEFFNICYVLENVNSRHSKLMGVGNDEDAENDEYRFLPPETNMLILDEDVKDVFLTSTPLKNLCKEDCKGLCQHCGVDLNINKCSCENTQIDPRWAKLFQHWYKKNIL